MFTSGEVPNLFAKDEIGGLCEDVRADAKKAGAGEMQDELYAFFLGRVIKNLHIVLCMSPIGDGFRERCRMFPGLVNCCTIDWFTEWPSDALQEVAKKQMAVGARRWTTRSRTRLCTVFATCHRSTAEKSERDARRSSSVRTTSRPRITSSLSTATASCLNGEAVEDRRHGERSSAAALEKLDETGVQVAEMSKIAAQEKQVVVAQGEDRTARSSS